MISRNPSWAEPVSVTGLDNAYRITPTLYRSAKPSAEALKNLSAMGVKTVIDLEVFSLFEWFLAKRQRLDYHHISCKPWHPELEDARAFIKYLLDDMSRPGGILFHCRQGADRTGMMCAVYRIEVQGWSKEDAIDEMVNGGYGFHGDIWTRIVPFIKEEIG